MKFGNKYIDFINTIAEVEFLEGTTMAGKTTVGLYKFMMMVADSPKQQHIISALDKGLIEKNLINKDHGLMEEWRGLIEYYGNGSGKESLPHIKFRPNTREEKVIYCLGYADKKRWQKALGGQYGCLYIDEINIADIEFVREAAMRSDYIMATLNPDDPSLPIYSEYINHSRPVEKWRSDTPHEILQMLDQTKTPKWVHWFFSFKDNVALSAEKIERAKRNIPEGTKIYKNKILGLRGRATGLVFPNFSRENIITKELLKWQIKSRQIRVERLTAGLDTSYSATSDDTIAMEFGMITSDRRYIVLDELVYNNRDLSNPTAPSDTAVKFIHFLRRCEDEWGICRNVFIDSADQATITELNKYKRLKGCTYVFNNSYKKVKIIDRINFVLGWLVSGHYQVVDTCKAHIKELQTYSWKEDGSAPEDRNDHTINATQYSWIPYRGLIGEVNGTYGEYEE